MQILPSNEPGGVYTWPDNFVVVAIVADSQDSDEVDFDIWGISRHLIDRFALSYTLAGTELDSFMHHSHISEIPLSGAFWPTEIPKFSALASRLYVGHLVRLYISDLLTALRLSPCLESRMLGNHCSPKVIARWSALWAILQSPEDQCPKEVVPNHVRSVLLSLIGHRIGVRKHDRELARFWEKPEPVRKSLVMDATVTVEGVVNGLLAEV